MRRIFVVGTADTKGEELAYLRSVIAEAEGAPIVVDVGIGRARCDADIPRIEIAAHHPGGVRRVRLWVRSARKEARLLGPVPKRVDTSFLRKNGQTMRPRTALRRSLVWLLIY